MQKIAMIPARMGSQRLQKKNLAPLKGEPLIVHAIRKCIQAGIFDRVIVNSEHPDFGIIAEQENAEFYQRPTHLGSSTATSEDFVEDFLIKNKCDYVFQVHSIAPLLTVKELEGFVKYTLESGADVVLSTVDDQLEAICQKKPVNFTFLEKSNSQDLPSIRKISWAITAWRSKTFLAAKAAGKCATYAGKRDYYTVGKLAGHVIKNREDLSIAEALFDLVHHK